MTAAAAADALGVNRATLYAYVSRGLVRSQATAGSSRARGYAREDVERLRRRTEDRRDPDKAAARALQWGVPVLESSITLIDGRRLYYRGHDAVALAETRPVQEVASLIWTGGFDTVFPPNLFRPRRCAKGATPSVRGARPVGAGARASARDATSFDARSAAPRSPDGGFSNS